MTRQATTRLLGMIEDGVIERDTVITAALKYMSEAEVADMCQHNDFFDDEDEDDDTDEEDEDFEDVDEDREVEGERGSRCSPTCGWCGACA